MLYQLKYHSNPDCVSIHIDKQLTKEMIESFENKNWEVKKMPQFVKDFFSVAGITRVSLNPHKLSLVKSSGFSWDEIIEKVIFILQIHFEPEGKAEEIAVPIKQYIGKEAYKRDISQSVKGELHSSKIFEDEKDNSK